MEIGFAAPVSGSWATPDNLALIAQRAESLGYRSLWTFQRLLAPVDHSWGEQYRSVYDPLVTLGYLGALTTRIRLGVAVVNMPFFAPALLAKQLTTLDLLTRGRLEVGLGVGWAPEEFVAVGVPLRERGRRAEEFLAALESLWTRDIAGYDGEFYHVPPSRLEPKPVQRPRPPLLLGGTAPAALRRAGRLADGWVSSSRADLTSIGDSVAIVKDAAAAAGRDPAALRFVCRGVARLRDRGTGVAGRRPLTGTPEQIRGDFAGLAAQGITELFIDLNFDPEIGSPDADPARSMAVAARALDEFAPVR